MLLFHIIDDDEAVRSMLAQIIEDEGLGEVAGEVADGSLLDGNRLDIDILERVIA